MEEVESLLTDDEINANLLKIMWPERFTSQKEVNAALNNNSNLVSFIRLFHDQGINLMDVKGLIPHATLESFRKDIITFLLRDFKHSGSYDFFPFEWVNTLFLHIQFYFYNKEYNIDRKDELFPLIHELCTNFTKFSCDYPSIFISEDYQPVKNIKLYNGIDKNPYYSFFNHVIKIYEESLKTLHNDPNFPLTWALEQSIMNNPINFSHTKTFMKNINQREEWENFIHKFENNGFNILYS